jgi:hypothetical protein
MLSACFYRRLPSLSRKALAFDDGKASAPAPTGCPARPARRRRDRCRVPEDATAMNRSPPPLEVTLSGAHPSAYQRPLTRPGGARTGMDIRSSWGPSVLTLGSTPAQKKCPVADPGVSRSIAGSHRSANARGMHPLMARRAGSRSSAERVSIDSKGCRSGCRPRRTQPSAVSASSPSSSPARIFSAIRPEFSRTAASMRAAISGLALRKVLAFSRPCPIRWLS